MSLPHFFFNRLSVILLCTFPLGVLYTFGGFHLAHWLDCSIAAAMVIAASLFSCLLLLLAHKLESVDFLPKKWLNKHPNWTKKKALTRRAFNKISKANFSCLFLTFCNRDFGRNFIFAVASIDRNACTSFKFCWAFKTFHFGFATYLNFFFLFA